MNSSLDATNLYDVSTSMLSMFELFVDNHRPPRYFTASWRSRLWSSCLFGQVSVSRRAETSHLLRR